MAEEETNVQEGNSLLLTNENPQYIPKHIKRGSYDTNIKQIESQQQNFANFLQEYQSAYKFRQSCNDKTFDELDQKRVYRFNKLTEEFKLIKLPKIHKIVESPCHQNQQSDITINSIQQAFQGNLNSSVAEEYQNFEKANNVKSMKKQNKLFVKKDQEIQNSTPKVYNQNVFINFSEVIQTSRNEQNQNIVRIQTEEISNQFEQNSNGNLSARISVQKEKINQSDALRQSQDKSNQQQQRHGSSLFMLSGRMYGYPNNEFSLRNSINSSPFVQDSPQSGLQQIVHSQLPLEIQQYRHRKTGLAPLS